MKFKKVLRSLKAVLLRMANNGLSDGIREGEDAKAECVGPRARRFDFKEDMQAGCLLMIACAS
jgi:hypothetical protein